MGLKILLGNKWISILGQSSLKARILSTFLSCPCLVAKGVQDGRGQCLEAKPQTKLKKPLPPLGFPPDAKLKCKDAYYMSLW